MAVEELLRSHHLFRTTDLDEARDFVGRVFCPHRLVTDTPDGHIDTVHNCARMSSLSLNYLDYGAKVHITPGELTSFFLVQIPLDGTTRVTNGKETVLAHRGMATVPNPLVHLDMTWEEQSPHLMVHVKRDVLESKLANLMSCELRAPLRFDLGLDLTAPQVVAWRRLLDLLVDDLETAVLHNSVRRQLEDLVLVGLLTAHQHNYSNCIQSNAEPVTPRAVRRAMDACEEDTGTILTVSELAQVADVSVRSLQEGFKNYVGLSPMQYLREVRLRRVRQELGCADQSLTVAAVANKWGFAHLGRFSQLYAKRFGETPSQTLRAVR